jgi:hypothetical protein
MVTWINGTAVFVCRALCFRCCRCLYRKKNLRLKTNNKSTGEAQSANYLKSRTDYTTKCQLVNAKLENDELNPA